MSVFSRGERFWLLALTLLLVFIVSSRTALVHHHRRSLFDDSVEAAFSGSLSEKNPHAGDEALSIDPEKIPLFPSDAFGPTPITAHTGSYDGADDQSFPIDINTASVDQFVLLPGIGPVIASRIVAYRDEHGPFAEVEQLQLVKGIGATRMERLRPFVTIIDGPGGDDRGFEATDDVVES